MQNAAQNTHTNKDSPLTLSRFQSHKEKRSSMIVAQVIVSESELAKVIPNYSSSIETDNPHRFKAILWELGMDVDKGFQRQDSLWHRNRLNEVVLCSRWVGDSRLDDEWINSGYASKEAKDKYSGSKILEDLYRERSATQDTQDYLESRDKYAVVDTSVWID